MKTLIVLAIPTLFLFSCKTSPEQSKNVVISGRITDEDSKKGISKAELTIYDQDTTIKVTTDTTGIFNLNVKKKSDYNFKIEAGGYVNVNGSFNFMKSDSVFSSYELVPYMDEDSADVEDAESKGAVK